MALSIMTTLAIVTTTVLYFSTESSHASSRTSGDQQAYALAEAGINTAVARIYAATDPRVTTILHAGTVGDPATVVPKCSVGTNVNENPTCYQTGSVTYSGTLNKTLGNTWYWTITSVGSVPVGGVATVNRKLTRSVGVTGNNGTNGNSWSRFYQDSTTSCLTLDGVTVPTNFASKGDICLKDGATVTGATTNIMAGGHIYVDQGSPTAKTAGTASNNSGWTSSTSAEVQDSAFANTSALGNSVSSANLDLSNFGFNIPSTATVNGIAVSISRKASASTSTNHINDIHIQAIKGGVTAGTDQALTGTNWPTTDTAQTYGGAASLWGTTWAYSDINASNFGIRIVAKSTCSTCGLTAYVNSVTVTVYWSTGASIGTSGAPIGVVDVGVGCESKVTANTIDSPCSGADKTYATTYKTDTPANNPDLNMPSVDWNYWWANAMPGPKHFCTNTNPGIATNFFDNNASTTSAPDASVTVNGEMAPPGHPYDCQVVVNGDLQGEIKWDGSHVFTIYGTTFVDGNFRFDQDGEIVHYFGRGTLMSSHDDEIDALVCAGGNGNTYATACNQNMSSWSPSQNMMVLMSECLRGLSGCNEYDQGGTTCSGAKPDCYDGHLVGGFQGILYSLGDCLIHQEFQDSGPVICNTISMPKEGSFNPTFYTFPSIGNLTDGMSFSSTASATDFSLNVSAQGDG
jgi:hypothetical protein